MTTPSGGEQYIFGPGVLFGVGSDGQPYQFGNATQETTLDLSLTTKELTGRNIFAQATGIGGGKITGKTKDATINGAMYNALFFNGTITAGALRISFNEALTLASHIGTPAKSAAMIDDLGVIDLTTGRAMQKVTGAPTKGTYQLSGSIGAWTYTFNASETAVPACSYSYTDTIGSTLAVNNSLQGISKTFGMYFYGGYNGDQFAYVLPACVSSKLTLGSKSGDFNISELDFACQPNAAGRIITLGYETPWAPST